MYEPGTEHMLKKYSITIATGIVTLINTGC